jgi:hypothetical protein
MNVASWEYGLFEQSGMNSVAKNLVASLAGWLGRISGCARATEAARKKKSAACIMRRMVFEPIGKSSVLRTIHSTLACRVNARLKITGKRSRIALCRSNV